MQLLVPDASIILKWFLHDEPHATKAYLVLDGYIQGIHQLIIPDFAYYEVSNVLTLPRTGLDYQRAKRMLLAFRRLRIPSVPFKVRDLNRAFDLTYQHNIRGSYYDALYLAVAEAHRGNWLTADAKAYRKLKALKLVQWLGSWTPSQRIRTTRLF